MKTTLVAAAVAAFAAFFATRAATRNCISIVGTSTDYPFPEIP